MPSSHAAAVRPTVLLASLALGGCISLGGQPAAPVSVAAGPAPLVGLLAGPVGAALDERDRQTAAEAELRAAETGQRASWRSPRGHFGLVEPGPETQRAAGLCRPFTHAIYIDGRAERGAGLACRRPEGGWAVVS